MKQKPRLSFWQIWNMSFGFLGIQFGFALQMANTSRIFRTLGANIDDIAILWIAAPVTGLFVQPIIGYFSDRTWHPRLGRRRPYFLLGAILASLSLLIMPNSPTLWVAGGMLWLMDASFNISMEPFRAFVGDNLPEEQHTLGFSMQSFFIGVGATIASLLPLMFEKVFQLSNEAAEGVIPLTVRLSFYVGAVAFLGAVLWTVFTSKEYPPEEFEAFHTSGNETSDDQDKKDQGGVIQIFKDIFIGVFQMPKTMQQLAVVQFFTWFGLFAMWLYTTDTLAQNVWGTAPSDTSSEAYNSAGNWVGVCFAVYNAVPMLMGFLLPSLASSLGRKMTHTLCLLAGGIGLFMMALMGSTLHIPGLSDEYALFIPMIGIGIAWTSILAMPYAMLAGALPADRMGYFMGVFNFFIVIPQIIAATTFGFMLNHWFGQDPKYIIMVGGASIILAAIVTLAVDDKGEPKSQEQ